ncbi:hypothetical protein NDU88_003812 [Pleurodeles waltl]|uniref:Uncharacterized protein n=1 Tax=Pleurodeles waltl TaxID=8319 RepID=A0AAV7W776_PLEWA|nr:hypothetical protein NDU88_003812 [Pleurodeles waltl]
MRLRCRHAVPRSACHCPPQAAPSQRNATVPSRHLGTGTRQIPVPQPLSGHPTPLMAKSSPCISRGARRNKWQCGALLQSVHHVGSASHAPPGFMIDDSRAGPHIKSV